MMIIKRIGEYLSHLSTRTTLQRKIWKSRRKSSGPYWTAWMVRTVINSHASRQTNKHYHQVQARETCRFAENIASIPYICAYIPFVMMTSLNDRPVFPAILHFVRVDFNASSDPST
ncbi:hypothetical protein CIPAW_15G008100 [Carya illinoinensis]|uniref:Uncharacterized protein n=1 Tax=Carya illinoinensis TaxID=32201 RepID=A0A8T1N6C6_CARIL|nr:hypothetical protein CIPAW_15G008100 [Carya illinoinensis]